MIWWIALLILILGGTVGFIICSLICIEAVSDRDEQINRLQKQIGYEQLGRTIEKLGEGE